jgi:membrane-bound lytic murein transglycosylase B
MKSAIKVTFSLSLFLCIPATFCGYNKTLNKSQFTSMMVRKYHFSRRYIVSELNKIHFKKSSLNKIKHPAEKRNWDWYRNHFITQQRINLGAQYWKRNRKTLAYAKKHYGVDPSIIVSIIGIETYYGKNTGSFKTLNAIGTLAFHYPSRARFFQKELKSLFILCRKLHLDINTIKGSYAGALGIPQFMPSSYLAYAKKHHQHSFPNLISNHKDAILSIANYLKQHGWKNNEPIIAATLLKHRPNRNFYSKKPQKTVRWYKQHQIKIKTWLWPHSKATLMNLDTRKSDKVWLASGNYFAIMSYNPRMNYAMAVYQLSKKIQGRYQHDRKRL